MTPRNNQAALILLLTLTSALLGACSSGQSSEQDPYQAEVSIPDETSSAGTPILGGGYSLPYPQNGLETRVKK